MADSQLVEYVRWQEDALAQAQAENQVLKDRLALIKAAAEKMDFRLAPERAAVTAPVAATAPKRRKGRKAKAAKAKGTPGTHRGRKSLAEKNPKLAAEIAVRAKAGESINALAKDFDLSRATVVRAVEQVNGARA